MPVSVEVSGVEATASTGTVLVWGEIDPSVVDDWTLIAPTEFTDWRLVA